MAILYKILVITYLFFPLNGNKEYLLSTRVEYISRGIHRPILPFGILGILISVVGIITMVVNWKDFKSDNIFLINSISLTCVCLKFVLSYLKFVGITIYDILLPTIHKVIFFIKFYVLGLLIIYCSFKYS